MIDLGPEIKEALASNEKNTVTIKYYLIEKMASALADAALEIAPDENDFKEAVHVEGPNHNGDHALIVVEDAFLQTFEKSSELVNIMRSSGEWDTEVRTTPAQRAAYALVNEAYGNGRAEELWNERRASPTPSI
jgi:hypothetical protein